VKKGPGGRPQSAKQQRFVALRARGSSDIARPLLTAVLDEILFPAIPTQLHFRSGCNYRLAESITTVDSTANSSPVTFVIFKTTRQITRVNQVVGW
jgi:hypothetical protein